MAGDPWAFRDGNELAVTHGAYSARKVEPVAAELVQAILADPDVAHLHMPAYQPAVAAWAAAEARVILIEQWVNSMAIEKAAESDRGQTSPLELLRRWDSNAATHRARLGLDPLSRARLGRDRAAGAVDTAKVMAELHKAQAAADARTTPDQELPQ